MGAKLLVFATRDVTMEAKSVFPKDGRDLFKRAQNNKKYSFLFLLFVFPLVKFYLIFMNMQD